MKELEVVEKARETGGIGMIIVEILLLRSGETRKSDRDPSRKEVDVAVKVDKPRTYRDALIGRE